MRAVFGLFALLCCCTTGKAADWDFPRPGHTEHAKLARWLAHTALWGTISTWDDTNQRPVGGVASFSDGPPGKPTGRLFFYMTPMDETTQNFIGHPSCSFTITEAQLQPNGCSDTDPEDPTCAKITMIGQMQGIADAPDAAAAAAALFSRHDAMQQWPRGHQFTFFELKITEVHMLDWYGGMHIISASDYFAANLTVSSTSEQPQKPQRQAQQQKGQGLRPALRGMGSTTF